MFNLLIDKINLFELYNGLLKARNDQPSLGLDEVVAHVENTYKKILKDNHQYLRLEESSNSPVQSSSVHTV
jgi:hypothetical protein